MPLNLRKAGDRGPGAYERPIDLLLHCHAKIRSNVALGLTIAEAAAPPDREIADAAAALHRYFSVALPLHTADEEKTIRPRLLERTPRGPVALALDLMEREHAEHEVPLVDLLACWSMLAAEPRRRSELAPRLALVRRLEALLVPHLEQEETRIFPALELLSEETSRAILVEMRARRTPSPRP